MVADRIAAAIEAHGMQPAHMAGQSSGNGRPIGFYIHEMVPGSPFLHEVKTSLERTILDRDGIIARAPEGNIVVNLDVDLIRWSDHALRPDGNFAMAGAAGAAAILVADGGPYAAGGAAALVATTGIAADILAGLSPSTDSEIVWRASIVSGSNLVMQVQAPMYVADADGPLYLGIGRTPPVASLQPAGALPARQIRYQP